MTDRTRKIIIYSVSVLALTWSISNWESGDGNNLNEDTKPVVVIPEQVLPAADKIIINIREKESEPWGVDPFKSKTRRAKKKLMVNQPPVWNLTGIMYNEQSPIAYINKKAVRVGSMINEAQVIDISRSAVTLELKGNRFTLHVGKG